MIMTITAIALQPIEIDVSDGPVKIVSEVTNRQRFYQTVREICLHFPVKNIYIQGTESYIQALAKGMGEMLPEEYKVFVLSDPNNTLQREIIEHEIKKKKYKKYFLF